MAYTPEQIKAARNGFKKIIANNAGKTFGRPAAGSVRRPIGGRQQGPETPPDYYTAESNDAYEVTSKPKYMPADWDWKTATAGPNGEVMPPTALGWTATGEPAFRQGLGGWWDDFVWRVTRPRRGTPEKAIDTLTPVEQQEAQKALPMPMAYRTAPTVKPGATLRNVNQYIADSGEAGTAPSIPEMAVRAAGAATKRLIGAFGEPAQKFEQGAFGGGRGLEAAGEGSVLPEVKAPDWAKNLMYLLPPYRGYLAVRALTSPGTMDEKQEKFNPEYQAGRVAYSSMLDPMVREEYKRLLQDGFTPTQAEMATANPIAELAGELLLDPLNAAGVFGKGAHLSNQISAAEEFYKLPTILDKAARYLDDVEDVAAVNRLDDFVQAQKATSLATKQRLAKMAADTSLGAVTTGGKRYQIGRRAGEVARWIASETNGHPDLATDMFEALAKIASNDEAEIAEGLAALKHFPVPRPLLSEAGQELGIILRQVLGETPDGKLANGKDWLEAIKKIDDPEEIIKLVDQRMKPVIEQMLPDVAARSAAAKEGKALKIAGVDISKPSPATVAITNFDRVMQKAIYKPLNSFFAGMYMGLSPGYAARNAMSNLTHVAVDYGTGAFRHGPKGWGQRMFRWLGREKTAPTFGGVMAGGNVWKQARGLPFQKLSSVAEQMSGEMATGVAVERAMRKMLKPGRALPSLRPLIDAGMDPKAAETMARAVVDNFGDVNKAVESFITSARKGNIDAFEALAWLADDDVKVLQDMGMDESLLNAVKEGYQNGKSMDDVLADVRLVRDEYLAKASNAVDDIPQINPDLTVGAQDVLAIRGVDDGVAKAGLDAEASNFYTSLTNTTDAYAKAVNQAAAHIDTPEVNQAYRAWAGQYNDMIAGANKSSNEWTQNWVSNKYRDDWMPKNKNLDFNVPWNQMKGEASKYGVDLGDVPKDWKDFSRRFWEEFYYPVKQKYWKDVREGYVGASEGIINSWPNFSGRDDLLQEARLYSENARRLDDTIPPAIMTFKKQDALENGDVGSYAWLVAKQYGLEKPNEAHMLNIVNKYGGKQYKHITEADPKVIERAFEQREAAKAAEKLAAQAAPVERTLEVFDDPMVIANKLPGVPEEDLPKVIDDAKKIYLSSEENEFRSLEIARWYYFNPSNKDEYFRGLGAVTPAAAPAAEAPQVARIEYAPGAVPTEAQSISAQAQGITDMFDRIEQGVRDNWGKTYSTNFTPAMEKALRSWAKTAAPQVSQARLIASKVGDAARDFTLLSYPEKRYMDLALAYVYPFHFWYGRTYAHWLQRLAYNADIVAAYAKYRKAMEQIHAGAPEWWKYSINSDELLGIETDNPFFFNLETTLNPINGLSGVDFDDPQRTPNWWTAMLDDMNKFGPTLWTPISVATALALKMKGEDEAAARWGGRLIPQTAAVKSALSLMNVNVATPGGGVNEFDPGVQFFAGGVDPYERRRIGRQLYNLTADGYSEAEVLDAANFQEGPVWQSAAEKAVRERAVPQLMGSMFGWSFKARTASDMQIDKFYQDYYRFWAASGTRSPEEVRMGLEQMRQQYPFMDTILLSRKTGFARDRSYAYNVLSRIAPGQKDDLFKMAGIDPNYMDKFYAAKGDISGWKKTDRERFMAGIVDLGARLDMPDTATRAEWNDVRNRYSAIDAGVKNIYGDDIEDRISLFYSFKNKEDGYAYLDANPDVQEAMNWKDAQIINDPLMKAYYGSVSKIERYYNALMYDTMEIKYGDDIWEIEQGYYDAKLNNTQKQYLKQFPQLKDMWDDKDVYKAMINAAIIRAQENTVEVRRPNLRSTVPESMGEIGIDQGLGTQAQERTVYDYTWDDFVPMMSSPMQRIVMDYAINGDELSYAASGQLDYIAGQLDIDPDMLLQLMVNSLNQ